MTARPAQHRTLFMVKKKQKSVQKEKAAVTKEIGRRTFEWWDPIEVISGRLIAVVEIRQVPGIFRDPTAYAVSQFDQLLAYINVNLRQFWYLFQHLHRPRWYVELECIFATLRIPHCPLILIETQLFISCVVERGLHKLHSTSVKALKKVFEVSFVDVLYLK